MANALSLRQKTGLENQGFLLNTGWLTKLHGRTLVVCRIVLGDNQGTGTGFLIGKDLIMTNNHVLSSLEAAHVAKAYFFYTAGSEGIEVGFNPDDFFYTSHTPDQLGFQPIFSGKLDFTIASIHSHPKVTEISHLAFSIFGTPILKRESHATIIHHPVDPDGLAYQKVSFRENLIKEISLYTIHYTTATLPGSSGAPVVDDEGNLIALHRATCTSILKALLEKTMLTALLEELFPGVVFTTEKLIIDKQACEGRCTTLDGSALYVFTGGVLKGQYYHQGKIASLFKLIATQHTPAKEWALRFLNSRLEEPLKDHHKECNTAVTIKAIHDHLRTVNLLDSIRLRYEEGQKNLPSLLKERYLHRHASIPLVLTNTPFPIENFFAHLSIVFSTPSEKKDVPRRRDRHLVERDPLRVMHAHLCETEKPIEIGTLFDQQENTPIKRVLVLGRAGIGKSTLCQKIVHDWAAGILFDKKFTLVFHILLRNFKSQKTFSGESNEWMSRMIAESCYEKAHQEKIYQELQNNPEKILLVLDGWDEASSELRQALKAFFRETKTHYLLTSRPGATTTIHGNFDLIVENRGFNRTQIERYIETFFTHTECEGSASFLKMLRSRDHLLVLSHIPIQLQILCSLWQKGEQEFPSTLTPLFSKIVYHLFEFEQEKRSEDQKFTRIKKVLLYEAIGKIALKSLASRELIIAESMVTAALKGGTFDTIGDQDLMSVGLLKGCGLGKIYFTHLTFQEYSIARYICNLPNKARCSFVQTYRYQPHFHLVIRLLAGLLWEDSNKDIKTLEMFFEWLYSGHIDLIGSYQTELVLSCLAECPSQELEKRIWEKYKIADFVEYALERETRDCLFRFMTLSKRVFDQIFNKILELGCYKLAKWFLSNSFQFLRTDYISDALFSFVTEGLTVGTSNISYAAAKAFGSFVAYMNEERLPQVLRWIEMNLKDNTSNVSHGLAWAIEQMALHTEEEIILQILRISYEIFSSASSSEQRSTIVLILEGLLRTAKGGATTSLVMPLLEIASIDKEDDVRKRVIWALREYGMRPMVLDILNKAIREDNVGVRPVAFEVLNYLVEHVNEETAPQLVCWLQMGLNDEEPMLRSMCLRTVVKLAAHVKKELVTYILNLVKKFFYEKNLEIRTNAILSLGRLTAHVTEEERIEILNLLHTAFESDEYSDAIKALGEVVPHVKETTALQILDWLQIALRDEDGSVCNAAARSLGLVMGYVNEQRASAILKLFVTESHCTSSIVEGLGEVVLHLKKRTHLHILDWLQIVLRNKDNRACEKVLIFLEKLLEHVKEESHPQILTLLQIALEEGTSFLKIAPLISKINTPLLLSIFTSIPLAQPIKYCIFDHFISQSIPLYLVENSTSCSIHISDTYYIRCAYKQVAFLSNLCRSLLTNMPLDSIEPPQEVETCNLM